MDCAPPDIDFAISTAFCIILAVSDRFKEPPATSGGVDANVGLGGVDAKVGCGGVEANVGLGGVDA